MKLVLNAADFDDAGHRGERPAGEDAGLHPDQLWSAPEGGPLAAPYVKVKLDAIASEQYTPQMQLAHALKDARLALSRRAAHHAGAGKHRRTVAAGGGRGYAGEDLSAVYQWLSPSSKA